MRKIKKISIIMMIVFTMIMNLLPVKARDFYAGVDDNTNIITLSMACNKVKCRVNREIQFTVGWDSPMQALDISLSYNSELIGFTGAIIEGKAVGDDFINVSENGSDGKIRLAWAYISDEKDQEEISAKEVKFKFQTKANGQAELKVDKADAFADANLQIPSSINIANAKKTVLIGDFREGLFGDLNDDGVINQEDGAILYDHIDKTKTFEIKDSEILLRADLNEDGIIDIRDLKILDDYIVENEAERKLTKLTVIFGDMNGDKVFNSDDIVLLSQFISNNEIPTDKDQVYRADVNCDGVIDMYDVVILKKVLDGTIPSRDASTGLPGGETVEGVLPSLPIVLGDLDEDFSVTGGDASYLLTKIENSENGNDEKGLGSLNEYQRAAADVNCDGEVNKIDYLILCDKNSGLLSKFPAILGDVNGDGDVLNKDLEDLKTIIENGSSISDINQKYRVDVNRDGEIDQEDYHILSMYLAKKITKLPILYGDVNMNWRVNQQDAVKINSISANSTEVSYDEFYRADINRDGIITGTDANSILYACVGRLEELPLTTFKNRYNENNLVADIVDNKTEENDEEDDESVEKIAILKNLIDSEDGRKVSSIKSYFVTDINPTVLDKNNNVLADSAIVGTGNIVRVTYLEGNGANNSLKQEYQIVYYGDCTGDGKINAIDALAIIKHRTEKILFTSEVYIEAARVDSTDGNLGANDALRIIKYSLDKEKYEISQKPHAEVEEQK